MFKTKNVLLFLTLTVSIFWGLLVPVQAQSPATSGQQVLEQGSTGSVMEVLNTVLNIMSGLVGVLAVIMLIVAGFQYSPSRGDPNGVKAAKNRITNVLIGLVAYIFLYAFLQWLIPGGL
jgi:hypothetical protein